MTRKQSKMIADKMSVEKVKKPKARPEPVNRPTDVRSWWLVDVAETRTLKVYATGPKQARDIAAHVMMDLYPPMRQSGDPLVVVKSVVHTVKCDEGRSTRDWR